MLGVNQSVMSLIVRPRTTKVYSATRLWSSDRLRALSPEQYEALSAVMKSQALSLVRA